MVMLKCSKSLAVAKIAAKPIPLLVDDLQEKDSEELRHRIQVTLVVRLPVPP